jgi:predicted Rossmann-fold nucleotide-binding protein
MVLLDAEGCYGGLLRWLSGLVPAGFIRPGAVELLTVVDSVPAALDTIEEMLSAAG